MSIINSLPDEVMIEIFGYLGPNMLKSCNLVCKRWDDIISSSKELMTNFQLVLCEDSDDYEETKELKRNYQKIVVRNLCTESLNVIRPYNLRKLNVCSINNLKLSDLVEAIRNLPTLKVFSAWEVKFEDDIPDIQNFKRIRVNIETIRCVAEVLRIFDCSSLKKIRLLWNHEMPLERKLLTYELLSKQRNLKNFMLSEYVLDNFFHSPEIFLKFQFCLRRFQYFSAGSPLTYYRNFIRFLDSQKNSLKILDLEMQPHKMFIIEEIQKYVLENMSNLKDLRLDLDFYNNYTEDDIDSIPEMEDIPQPTQVTKNIERLSYKGPQRTIDKCKRIIDLFPNIKHLEFESDYVREFRVLKYASMKDVNLESLEFLSFHSGIRMSYSVYFPNLKELSSFSIDNEEDFSYFISRHSKTLERITIQDIVDMTELTANAIMECENLKFVKFGSYEDDLESLMWLFHKISSTNKPLTLIYKCYSASATFKFPDDKIFWDEKLGIEPEEDSEQMDSEPEQIEPALKSNNLKKICKAIWYGIKSIFSSS